jgi:outer membrane protein OmpA-like peptidoglycan-associated protein
MKTIFKIKIHLTLAMLFASNILLSQNILLEEKVLIGKVSSNIFIDNDNKTIALIDTLENGYQVTHFDIQSGAKRVAFIDISLLAESDIYGLFGDSIVFNADVIFGLNIKEEGICKMNIFTLEKKVIQAKHLNSKIVQGYYIDKNSASSMTKLSINDIYTNDEIEHTFIPDTLNYEFIAHSDSVWIIGLNKNNSNRVYFLKDERWSPFTYPINDSLGDYILELSILNDDSLVVVRQDDTSKYVSMFSINENLLESESDSINKVRIGTFDFFMRKEIDSNAVVKVNYSAPVKGIGQVVPAKEDVAYEVEKQKGPFSVIFKTFRKDDSEGAYGLLNSILKVFPKAFTSKRGDEIVVQGPRRTSLRDIEVDSAIAIKNEIPIFSIDSSDYSNWSSSEVMVTFNCINSETINSIPVSISFYSRSTGKLILQDTVKNGRVRFIYPINSDLGVTLTSNGHYPKSIRLNPADIYAGKSIFRQILFQEVQKDGLIAPQLNFQNILFDFNSDELKEVSFIELNSIKQVFELLDQDASITIEGHADSVGSRQYNYKLAERRAESVIRFFTEETPSISFKIDSKGETEPLMSNDTEFGRSVNRRVVIVQDSSNNNLKSNLIESKMQVDQDTIDITSSDFLKYNNRNSSFFERHDPLILSKKLKFSASFIGLRKFYTYS